MHNISLIQYYNITLQYLDTLGWETGSQLALNVASFQSTIPKSLLSKRTCIMCSNCEKFVARTKIEHKLP